MEYKIVEHVRRKSPSALSHGKIFVLTTAPHCHSYHPVTINAFILPNPTFYDLLPQLNNTKDMLLQDLNTLLQHKQNKNAKKDICKYVQYSCDRHKHWDHHK